MKTPFSRPFVSIAFYCLAGLLAAGYILFGAYLLINGGTSVTGTKRFLYLSVLGSFTSGLAGGFGLFTLGYIIELIARIEWNTRRDD